MADKYVTPDVETFKLPGSAGRIAFDVSAKGMVKSGKISQHDALIGKKLAYVLSGGNTTIDKELSEEDLYALELEAFVQLNQMEKTQARIKHTLSTGKPLVN